MYRHVLPFPSLSSVSCPADGAKTVRNRARKIAYAASTYWRRRPGLVAFQTKSTRCPSRRSRYSRINKSLTGVPRMSTSRRPMIRFEILLPLFSNDGRSIEREKFLQTVNSASRPGDPFATRSTPHTAIGLAVAVAIPAWNRPERSIRSQPRRQHATSLMSSSPNRRPVFMTRAPCIQDSSHKAARVWNGCSWPQWLKVMTRGSLSPSRVSHSLVQALLDE